MSTAAGEPCHWWLLSAAGCAGGSFQFGDRRLGLEKRWIGFQRKTMDWRCFP